MGGRPKERGGSGAYASEQERIDELFWVAGSGAALLQVQAEAGGDASAALEWLEGVASHPTARSVVSESLVGSYKAGLRKLGEILGDLDSPGGRSRFLDFLRSTGPGAIDAALAGTAMAFGVRNAAEADGFLGAAVQALAGSANGAGALASMLDSVNRGARLATVSHQRLDGLSQSASRIGVGLGILMSGSGLTDALLQFRDDPSFGRLVRLYGETVGLAGSVLEGVPGASVIGALVSLHGLLYAGVGQVLTEREIDEELDEQQRERLQALLQSRYGDLRAELGAKTFDEAVRRLAAGNDLGEMSTGVGLDTEQMIRLFASIPSVNGGAFRALVEYAASEPTLRGDDFLAYARALDETLDGFDGADAVLMNAFYEIGLPPDLALAVAQQLSPQQVAQLASSVADTIHHKSPEELGYFYARELMAVGVDWDAIGFDIESLRP